MLDGDKLLGMSPVYFYITAAFIAFQVLVTMFVLVFRRTPRNIVTVTNLVIVLGMLGTFVGISVGLAEFDTNNLDESLPALLDGLKSAFFASITGVTISSLIRMSGLGKRVGAPVRSITTTALPDSLDASLGSMVSVLTRIHEEDMNALKTNTNYTAQAQKLILTELKSVRESIVGDGETTMLTQIQKMRTSLNDKQDDLIEEFRQFAVTMADNNSKALIEALSAVIKDFNSKISEQFGENFRHLNDAVGKLLLWQDNYKSQLGNMIEQFEASVRGMQLMSDSVSRIAEKSEVIVKGSDRLQEILESTKATQEDLNRHIEAFASLAKTAQSAFPEIHQNIVRLTEGFQSSVEKANAATTKLLQEQAIAYQALRGQVDAMFQSLRGQMDGMVKENAANLTKQVSDLDKLLGEQLTKSLESLGSQLASLSGKFVEDYTPLTEKLRKVVELAGGGQR